MIQDTLRWLKGYRRVAALHIDLHKDGQWKAHAVVLSLNKNKIELISYHTEITQDGISALPLKDLPVSVLVTGKGNINRKTGADISRLNDINAALQLILPNARQQEFLVDFTPAAEGYMVSAIRKDQLEEQVLSILKENKIQYVSVQTGFTSSVRWYEYIAAQTDHLDISNYRMEFQQKKLKSLSIQSEVLSGEVVVLGQNVSSVILPAVLLGIELLAGQGLNQAVQSYEVSVVEEERYRYKQMFKHTLMLAAGLFFVVLLINFMLFSSYKKEYDELQDKELAVLSVVNKLKFLQKEVKDKETFLKSAGWQQSSRFSWYCDQLVQGMPEGLSLLELSVYPLDVAETRKEKKFIFSYQRLSVKGQCASPVKVNEWAQALDQQSWISSVSIDKYVKDSKTGFSEFYMTISLHEK